MEVPEDNKDKYDVGPITESEELLTNYKHNNYKEDVMHDSSDVNNNKLDDAVSTKKSQVDNGSTNLKMSNKVFIFIFILSIPYCVSF